MSESNNKSRIGRNPLDKKRSSHVKSMVQNKAYESQTPSKSESSRSSRNFFERVQDMNVRMDLKELVKSLLAFER